MDASPGSRVDHVRETEQNGDRDLTTSFRGAGYDVGRRSVLARYFCGRREKLDFFMHARFGHGKHLEQYKVRVSNSSRTTTRPAAGACIHSDDHGNSMSTSLILGDMLFGFLCALPFVGVREYRVRLMLSIGTPILLWIGVLVALIGSHLGPRWENDRIVRIVLGALLAAHLRTAWELIWSLAKRSRT